MTETLKVSIIYAPLIYGCSLTQGVFLPALGKTVKVTKQ